MLVSIIIPIYNSEKFIDRLLNSLIQQTYEDIEIILIDDGSTDKSLEICKKFKQNDSRIKLLSKENEGVSIARNKGIDVATGEYITFLDSDDTLDKKYIENLVENIEKDYLIRCNIKSIKNTIIKSDEYIRQIVSGKIQGVCWGYLFNKRLLENLKFDVNTSYMEDTIFIIQVLQNIEKVKIVKNAIYNYNLNQDSLTQNLNSIENRINGYIYSLDKIKRILSNDNFNMQIDIRKVKLLESEFAKTDDKEIIKKLLENRNTKQIANTNKISLKYKLFIHLIKKQKLKEMLLYIRIRNKIKKLVKRK